MLQVEITQDIKKTAWRKSAEMGKLKNSITKGDGNIAGFIGEGLVAQYLGIDDDNTYDYDLVYNGKKIDVKTKRCTSEPKESYECSISAYNTRQKCELYVFVRVENINRLWKRAWILGWMPKDEYLAKAKLLKKGDVDKTNNFTAKSDCYNLRIDELRPIEELKNG